MWKLKKSLNVRYGNTITVYFVKTCIMCIELKKKVMFFLLIFFLCVAKKSFIGQNKSFFGPLELVEKLCPEASDLATSVKNLPELKWVEIDSGLCEKENTLQYLCMSGVGKLWPIGHPSFLT